MIAKLWTFSIYGCIFGIIEQDTLVHLRFCHVMTRLAADSLAPCTSERLWPLQGWLLRRIHHTEWKKSPFRLLL